MDTAYAIKLFGALFAIMNPISNLPIFLGVTEGASVATQRAIALKVALYALVMGAVFSLAGSAVLKLFGITIADFRTAGGLVLLLIALNMLNGDHSSSHHGSEGEQENFPDAASVAFYPLTFPIIIGPGTIATLIVFAGQAETAADKIAFGVVFAGLVALLGLVFYFAADIGKHLSETARAIMSRLMGMILAAIAVGMITTGLKDLLPGLG
ncbi:MarC family protein [Marinibacterium sp. SX1]|uniref:MarC family protein n=1 Tax=Marinibacterium sp. SX1 TaxID=3388424 RepID=UPI003D177773